MSTGGAPGAPGATDAERAAWLSDKIGALGDYAKEAAAMLRRWPVAEARPPEAARDAIVRALIAIGHQITADEIRFFRDPRKDTTALAQLCDSLESAWPAGVMVGAPWRPIATAPAGGGDLLLWWKGRGAGRGRWQCDESGEGWILDGDRVIPAAKYQGDCTHWMPLPAGPAAGVAAGATDHVARELAAVQPPWPKERRVGRRDDMSVDGKLHVMLQEDGDVCVQVVKGATSPNMSDFQQADIEFCVPGSGGGRSPRTREALVALMVAIEADNAAHPIPADGVAASDGSQPE